MVISQDPCYYLTGGIGAVVIGGLLLLASRKERYPLKLAGRLPATPIAQLQEGMVQVRGRAMGTATVQSQVLGLNCLISRCKVESYDGRQTDDKWVKHSDKTERVPFYIEDESGRVWVDPGEARLELLPDLEFTTREKWRPPQSQRQFLNSLRWNEAGLEARVRDVFFASRLNENGMENLPPWLQEMAKAGQDRIAKAMENPEFQARMAAKGLAIAPETFASEMATKQAERQAKWAKAYAQEAQNRKIRVTEMNLLPGDPVYVIGPAYTAPPGPPAASQPASEAATPMRIMKGYPSDTFIIGEGQPGQVQQRLQNESRKTLWMALGFLAVGIWMVLDCAFH